MLPNSLKLSTDDWFANVSVRHLVILTCCLAITAGAIGAVASQSSEEKTGDIIITINDSSNGEDTINKTITINSSEPNDSAGELARFDTNGNGVINRDEAVKAVIAYNSDDTINGDAVSRDTAVSVIIKYNNGGQI